MVSTDAVETLLLALATAMYVAAMGFAMSAASRRAVLALMVAGLGLFTAGLALRWTAVGHGPFTTLYEVLASSVWSLGVIYAVAYAALPALRGTSTLVLPLLVVLAGWMLASDDAAGHLPPTFDTPLLYVHSAFGKLFLGLLMISAAIGAVLLVRRTIARESFIDMPADGRLLELSYRFAAFAFVFDTLMLIVGAVWAQDAWGRYWAWDPLETWAFLSWLALAFSLHFKIWVRPPAVTWGVMACAVFLLGFLTFFGVPFVSDAPHKGIF